MVDKSSKPHTSTCSNTTTTNTSLRAALNAVSTYRGTTYRYPQQAIIPLVVACLQELGFTVTSEVTTYRNQIVFSDYGDDVVLQMFNSAASINQLSMLFPRNASQAVSVGSLFNSGTSCRATLRMLGGGPGKTKTVILLGTTVTPALNNVLILYFTEAKYLPTGEMKKAVVIGYNANVYFYPYDADWTFLPGFASNLTTYVENDIYWQQISGSLGHKTNHDPYTSYYLMYSENFPIIPTISGDGLWEFPDIIMNPYGLTGESALDEIMKYALTSGTIYQIGSGKYLCTSAGQNYYLFRVE